MMNPPQLSQRLIRSGWLVAALLLPAAAWATTASQDATPIHFFSLAMQLLGGLALFLYGMEKMATSLKLVAGDRMKNILRQLTTNRVMGMITGAFVTAIIQSSSVTTVLLVGFVSAELMTLAQAMGVIFGANIGTTITAQVIAFKVTKYAMLMILTGFLMLSMGKTEKPRQYGHLLFGLGLVFFGMSIMSTAMEPLRSYEPFMALMQKVSNPLIGVMLGTLFTALVQSSSATTGVILALAMQGLISLEAGIALTLGANIGTCVTAILASLGKPREAVRVAMAHTTFNVLGALLIVGFIPAFADLVRTISPTATDLDGLARLAAEVPRQVANAHSIFNLGMAILFLPFANFIAAFCEWLIADKPSPVSTNGHYHPKYLDDAMLSTPAFALSLVRREMNTLSDQVEQMIGGVLEDVRNPTPDRIEKLHENHKMVNEIHLFFTRHLSKMGSRNMPTEVANEVLGALNVAVELKYMSDIVATNVGSIISFVNTENVHLPPNDAKVLQQFQNLVVQAYKSATTSYITDNNQGADMAIAMKQRIISLDAELRSRQIRALHAEQHDNLAGYTIYMDLLDVYKRLFYHAKRIAKIQNQLDTPTLFPSQETEEQEVA
jgi:phosphate:Na+ symporter